MSYEGYDEYICANGHHFCQDCHDGTPEACSCGAKIEWWHPVDQTNGYIEDDPDTYQASKKETGFDDEWCEDHHGNRFAVKRYKYKPTSDRWRTKG